MHTDPGPRDAWWRGAVIYQIYPRSFADADGDGIGDLRGIAERLPYVADLGVQAIWLSPFFASPMRDFGYDVSDHRAVDPMFGTLADFDALVARAHRLGLRVLIDQVWSHTAEEHAWFADSRAARHGPRADWYVWADARPDGSPPNNWLSWMGGPAWRWEPRRRQYHLHNFLPQMPDLNFHCPAVQDEVLDIARFWLGRGVDGFRLDTANLYFHDPLLRDNPPSGIDADMPVLMQCQRHNADQPQAPSFFERLRRVMDEHGATMAVAEVGGADAFAVMRDYTDGVQRLHTAYSFALLGPRPDAASLARSVGAWATDAPRGWPAWAMSNHDAARVATRWAGTAGGGFAFGGAAGARAGASPGASAGAPASARAGPVTWLALLMALRGTAFVYQGEELGLPQSALAREDLRDPFGIANWPRHPGRDGCRTPMPWRHDAPGAGFGSARPWLPCDPAHARLAADLQLADTSSTLQATRRLIALRRSRPALQIGSFEPLHADGDLLLLRRRGGGDDLIAAFHLGDADAELAWPAGAPRAGRVAFAHGAHRRTCAGLALGPGACVFLDTDPT